MVKIKLFFFHKLVYYEIKGENIVLKIFLIITLILIIIVVVLILIIKSQNKKIKAKDNQIKDLIENGKSQETKINNIMGELEIERTHNKQLAKKLADISCMSIDDVISQLQNNGG